MMDSLIMDMDQAADGSQMEHGQKKLTKEKSVEISPDPDDRY